MKGLQTGGDVACLPQGQRGFARGNNKALGMGHDLGSRRGNLFAGILARAFGSTGRAAYTAGIGARGASKVRARLGWLLLVLAGLGAQAQPALRLSLSEYPPYMGRQLPGQGILSTVTREVFLRAGIAINLVDAPNNRAISGTRQGLYDGSLGWARTAERERDLLFSAPVLMLRMVFCQRRGERYAWTSLADLAPYTIGITRGNFYSDEFETLQTYGQLHVDPANSDVENLRKLLAHRIDLLPMDAEVGPYLIHSQLKPAEAARLDCPEPAYWSVALHVVLSRKLAHGPALLADFDRALAAMRASGELTRLIDSSRTRILKAGARR